MDYDPQRKDRINCESHRDKLRSFITPEQKAKIKSQFDDKLIELIEASKVVEIPVFIFDRIGNSYLINIYYIYIINILIIYRCCSFRE